MPVLRAQALRRFATNACQGLCEACGSGRDPGRAYAPAYIDRLASSR